MDDGAIDILAPVESTQQSSISHSQLNEDEDTPRIVQTKSQKIGTLQGIFNDNQKLAYVGLCYLSLHSYKKKRLSSIKAAVKGFDYWSKMLMEKLYVFLDLALDEQLMINQLAEHGLEPTDLSKSLIQDAKTAAESYLSQEDQNLPSDERDIRYTILSHLFILCVSDGTYDARERALLKRLAEYLMVPISDIIVLESSISDQLRVNEELSVLRKNDSAITERNSKDSKARWVAMGLATLAGGAVIGLTAGLAAPLIGAGMTAALGALGVTGVAGTLTGATGSALIITGGVLTGGGVSGKSMLKRTGGLTEFEFISYIDAMQRIADSKVKREKDRRRRLKLERKKGLDEHVPEIDDFPIDSEPIDIPSPAFPRKGAASSSTSMSKSKSVETSSVFWEATSEDGSDKDDHNSSRTLSDARIIHNLDSSHVRQANVLITVAGWQTYDENDFTLPFSTLIPNRYGDQYSLIWESKDLQKLGSALKILGTEVATFLFQQGLAATVLPVLMAGLTGPLWAIKLTYLMDNPWGIGLDKASRAGKVLAETLISQVQENRPVTLVGFSLGARLIYFCLLELHKKGMYGLIEDVYLFGCPVMSSTKEWIQVASVVAGKIVNGYMSKDWVLGVLYRASSASWSTVAGLGPVDGIDGFENVCLDDVIDGHLEYRLGLPKILHHCGFNITQDYFDDEDEMEEKLLEELKEVRRVEAEVRLAKKTEEMDKREQIRQKIIDEKAELKCLGVRNTWRGTPEIKPKRLESCMPTIVVEDDEFSFMPKELTSTLPTLIVERDSEPKLSLDVSVEVKELESSLDHLHISSTSDLAKLTGSDLEARVLRYASEHQNQNAVASSAGAGDLSYVADTEQPTNLTEDEDSPTLSPAPFESFLKDQGALNVWDNEQWDV